MGVFHSNRLRLKTLNKYCYNASRVTLLQTRRGDGMRLMMQACGYCFEVTKVILYYPPAANRWRSGLFRTIMSLRRRVCCGPLTVMSSLCPLVMPYKVMHLTILLLWERRGKFSSQLINRHPWPSLKDRFLFHGWHCPLRHYVPTLLMLSQTVSPKLAQVIYWTEAYERVQLFTQKASQVTVHS